MKYQLIITEKAENDLKKLSPEVSKLIRKKLKAYLSSPNPLAFAKRLTDDPLADFRFRVRKWRVKFILKNRTIYITEVKLRPDAYRR